MSNKRNTINLDAWKFGEVLSGIEIRDDVPDGEIWIMDEKNLKKKTKLAIRKIKNLQYGKSKSSI